MIDKYIRQYGKRLYGLCLKLCGNSFEADDLYQDTWLRILNNFHRYDPSLPFEPWAAKICVNIYRNTLRRIARSPFLQFRTDGQRDNILSNIPAREKEDYAEIHAAIDGLPEKLRITVILFYFQDMNISAVSQALGIPEGTVKSRLSKARKLLKEVLEHEANL